MKESLQGDEVREDASPAHRLYFFVAFRWGGHHKEVWGATPCQGKFLYIILEKWAACEDSISVTL